MPPRSPLRSAFAWAQAAARTTIALPAAAAVSRVSTEASHRLMRAWSTQSLRALGLEANLIDANAGRYDDPPYLFVHLNQTSLVETFLFAQLEVPVKMIVNLEFALIPILGPSLWAMGAQVLVRQWPAQAKARMRKAAGLMRDDHHSFGMSVEGYRSRDGTLQSYKRGAAVLAIEAQARVVPFFIHGAQQALPYGEWRVRPGKITVQSFAPIDTRGMTLSDRFSLTDKLRDLAQTARA